MSDSTPQPIPFRAPSDGDEPPRTPPKLKKLRLTLVVTGLCVLALISMIFGMLMALASDLPALENREDFRHARNSVLLDYRGRPLGILTGNKNRILVRSEQISPVMKHAIIAIEDRRFYENQGFDLRGMARALVKDVTSQSAAQGASTITQQFVKNALEAQSNRTVFQKLKEAAVAYHLTRRWSKQKILTEYLNAIYYGNGAYGIESAARVYFGSAHFGCGTSSLNPCAAELQPHEAALIAGIIASPSAYDPIAHPAAATERRNLVLKNMQQQGYITSSDYSYSAQQALPAASEIAPPREKSAAPYFTTWVKQQVVEHFGARRAFSGGLKVRTTLDLDLQQAAEQAVAANVGGIGPSSALVAIDNRTGEVRAMVGGSDYNERPFNLATQGQRQPGSSFKPFVLAAALRAGISPGSTWASRKKEFIVPNTGGQESFIVNNYEDSYAGVSTLASATVRSDNSVYAEIGIKVGVKKVARLAERMGIRTPVSQNYAITLGGLKQGVTPLDMAHAYQTFAHRGELVYGSLGAPDRGPVGIDDVRNSAGDLIARNRVKLKRVLPKWVANTTTSILQMVVTSGTGKSAATGDFAAGKTGTTEDYGDAWFVGFTRKYTVAVWVGYADRVQPMKTEYGGDPVAGGTFPAEIWHDFVVSAQSIDKQRAALEAARRAAKRQQTVTTSTEAITVPTVTRDQTTDTSPQKTTRQTDRTTPEQTATQPQTKQPTQTAPQQQQTSAAPTGGTEPGTGGQAAPEN